MNNKTTILHPIGLLRQYTKGISDIEIEPDQTVDDLFQKLGIPSQIVALVLANKTVVPKVYKIRQGDYIEIMAVLGGG